MVIFPQLVQNFLEASADHWPNKVALICENRRLTYAEIETSANRISKALIDGGVRRGDRFAIYLPNSIASVLGIFGALKASATFVVINATTKLDKLINILNNCQATAILFDTQKMELAPAILQACPSLRLIIFSSWSDRMRFLSKNDSVDILDLDTIERSYPVHRPPVANIDLDLACLIYTSGSTGEPKGVMCDHSNINFATSSIIQYLDNAEEDIIIDVLPLSFDYGLYQLLMVFKFGGTLVLERSFTYPVQILKSIEQEKVTGFPGVPTIFSILLRMDLSGYDFTNLRYITNTAAALPPSQIQQLCKRFPQAKIFSMYGLTETKRTLYLPPEQLNNRAGSVGIPIPGTEAWIENEEGYRVACGEIGELVVRGRHVMRGYWGDEAATAERFRPGPLPGERVCYTGDLFRMDEEGFFYFVSRKDDILKCRGEKVAPMEIENILYKLQDVLEAAVVGIRDPILGEAVKVFIVSGSPTLTETAVLAHCRQNLEDFMMPRYVVFLEELPKTPSGKIDKRKLAEQD
jgi:acyl-CoA synthetase (AMP-forming)/AMP-acid ligase II